jgi:hypothetical protein
LAQTGGLGYLAALDAQRKIAALAAQVKADTEEQAA